MDQKSINTRKLLLVLTQVPGIGPAKIKALLETFDNQPERIAASCQQELQCVPGIGATLARQLDHYLHHGPTRQPALEAAEKQLEALDRYHAGIVTILDDNYPPLLREIYDPPPLLFVRGNLPASTVPPLAIVGTRYASPYGRQVTSWLCRELVRYGIPVISGLAFGIDMAAHEATLKNGGTTVAVLATGVDTIYTDPYGKLWPSILERGAIISEEWFGSKLSPGKFPKRNRIISGMTAGTVVVESDLKGGSMITASAALEQNREVFAVPGTIFSRTSRGTNRLIQIGQAKAVMVIDDILDEIGLSGAPAAPDTTSTIATPLGEREKQIILALQAGPQHIDTLALTLQLDIAELLVTLFDLELSGRIEQLAGQIFQCVMQAPPPARKSCQTGN